MFPEVIDLNVGGVFYTTSLTTLTKISGSYFADLFANHLRAPTKDAHGRYFIDRDGVLFRYVLEYLRSGEIQLPENFQETERLRHEARFYRLGDVLAEPSPLAERRNGNALAKIGENSGGTALPPLPAAQTPCGGSGHGRPGDGFRGVITIGYRGTFAFGREGTAEVKFRKLTRILVCGRVSLCREVFGETLNESRDPDRGSEDRYTARFFLKHSYLEHAFDMLLDRGFRLAGCCGTGTSSAGSGLSETGVLPQQKAVAAADSEEGRWNHYNEFVWQRLSSA